MVARVVVGRAAAQVAQVVEEMARVGAEGWVHAAAMVAKVVAQAERAELVMVGSTDEQALKVDEPPRRQRLRGHRAESRTSCATSNAGGPTP